MKHYHFELKKNVQILKHFTNLTIIEKKLWIQVKTVIKKKYNFKKCKQRCKKKMQARKVTKFSKYTIMLKIERKKSKRYIFSQW